MDAPDNTSGLEQYLDITGNETMKLSMGTVCGPGGGNGSIPCKTDGMGISLSTPILMLSSGLLGNTLALVVLYTMKKEVKLTVFFTLLAGLAWTDLIGQLMTGPMAVIVYANNLKWVGGEATCMYHAFAMICFGLLTPLLVCAMSLDRLIALKFTFFYARTFTRKKAIVAILLCWIFVLFVCSWPLMGFGSYEKQFPGSWCFLNYHRESEMDIAFASTYSVINIVLIIINFICNIIVVWTVIRMRKRRIIQNSPSLDRRHRPHRPKSQKRLESETQMVVFLCAITLVFTVLYLPLNVNILLNQLTGITKNKVDLICVRLASINQILDPWLYILLRRAQLLKILNNVKMKIYYAFGGTSSVFSSKQFENISQEKKDSVKGNSYVLKTVIDIESGEKKDPTGSESTGSRESLGSTSQLIPENDKEIIQPRKFIRSVSADNSHPVSCQISDSDLDVFHEGSTFFTTDVKRTKDILPRRQSSDDSVCQPRVKRLYSLPNNIKCLNQNEDFV